MDWIDILSIYFDKFYQQYWHAQVHPELSLALAKSVNGNAKLLHVPGIFNSELAQVLAHFFSKVLSAQHFFAAVFAAI